MLIPIPYFRFHRTTHFHPTHFSIIMISYFSYNPKTTTLNWKW